ncbi:GTP pyrophosphokinase [Peptoniphilus genitalis]|uniref:GTP pyrophosphokinase n=1 Tax=Peptoniphilus genitalis TaxID=3036303 RepID=UPI0024ADE567|nr:GTP pyrophosphokinase [Peptoniphilus sp. Marseille-Q7072]
MIDLLRALFIAARAHKGQKDKGGKSYIFHPINVSLNVKGKDEKIVALLHDVIEDTSYTIDDLKFLTKDQKEALLLLTHDKETPYMTYIEFIKKNKIASRLKLADLDQNMNLKRLKIVTEKDLERLEKYKKARDLLREGLVKNE